MTALDPRLHAFRADLADSRLAGQVAAERYSEGELKDVVAAVADVRREPAAASGLQTQLLRGSRVRVFDEREGWAWVQAERDGYVGYVAVDQLAEPGPPPTHRVGAARTFLYARADMKSPALACLSIGSELAVVGVEETRGTRYAVLADGAAAVMAHLTTLTERTADYVAVAEGLLHTPYLWGGASAFGIDCSGLVQLSLRMAGRSAPRDSDMQAAALGEPIGREELRRGDLVFWKGHVAIVADERTIIHANGHSMTVAREGREEAIARIGYLYGQPTGYRRP